MLKPFFINTNLCYGLDECQTSAQFFDNVGGNTGNSYIGYSIIKILYGKLIKVPEIKNISNNFFNSFSKLCLFAPDKVNGKVTFSMIVL